MEEIWLYRGIRSFGATRLCQVKKGYLISEQSKKDQVWFLVLGLSGQGLDVWCLNNQKRMTTTSDGWPETTVVIPYDE